MKNLNFIVNRICANTPPCCSKRASRFVWVLVLMLTLGVGQMWGTEATLSSVTANTTSTAGGSVSTTFNGVTCRVTKKGGNTSPGFYASKGIVRYYSGDEMTLSVASGNTITQIDFTMYSGSVGTASPGTLTDDQWKGSAQSVTFTGSNTVKITSIVVTYSTAASCDKKIALTKGSQTNGTFTLDKANGSYDNCDANFVVTVSSISANTGYYCTGVTATGGNSSVSGPDGSGNYTVTYTKGNSITSTVTANFAAKTSRTVTFMRNGVQYGDVRNVYDGDAVGTLPSNPTSCDANKVFAGWSEAQIGSTPTDDAPTFISASTVVSGSNKVYHAVFATDATPAGNLFSWEGSSTNDLASLTGMTGVTSSGLGSYAAGNAPYRVQFDNSSDYITISLSSAPSALTLTTKKIGGAGNSSFTIQESTASNGTFTDVQTFTCTGAQNATATHTTSTAFKTTTRAIKITFSKASNGNTGVGSIIITPGASYSGYITSCCTELGSINGSVLMSQKSATLSWDLANAQNGGKSHITSWKVEYKKDGGNWTTAESTLAVGTLTKTISNLDCNSDYSFRVSANVEDGYCADAYEVSGKTTQYTITLTGSGTVSGGEFTVKGQKVASVSACDGDNIAIVATRSTGYNFSGWTITNDDDSDADITSTLLTGDKPTTASTSFTMPAENVTVTAAFAAQHYNVVFHKNDGGEDEQETQDFTFGVAQTLSSISTIGWSRTNYNFGGWMTDPNGTEANYQNEFSYTLNSESDINLYALWVADNTRTIAYSGDEHINYSSKPTSVAQDAANFTASFSLATGYELKGVTATMGGAAIAADKIAFDQTSLTITAPAGGFTDNIAVTFNVAEIKYTVTFHAGTGTCGTESMTQASYGAAIELPSATIGAQGWSFVGWAEASVASATSIEPTLYTESFTPAADDDLYAVYRKTITEGGTSQVKFTYPLEGNEWTTTGSAEGSYYLLEGSEYMESPEIADMSTISSIKVKVGKYNNKGAYTITGGGTQITTGDVPSSTGGIERTTAKANFTNTLSGAGKIRLTNTDGSSGAGTRLYYMTINIDVAAVYSYHSTPASATGLAVQVAPTKTVYKVGDTFDPAGTTLRVTYSNSTTEDITSGFTYSPTTALTKENTSVTLSYLGLNCNQAISVLDPVATPTFSPASGSEVSVSETITISCETASATIYYTTDGSDPTNTSAVYSTPIAPYSTIKAIAMKAGMAPSEIATATYTVVKNSQTLSFTNSSYSFRLNSDEYNAFEHQAVSGAVTTVTYSSSNTAVADVEDGVVVLKGGKGTATITATAAETATYSEASATYTITVLRAGVTRTGDFVLVTDVNDLAEGDYVILTEEDDDNPYVFSGITSNTGTVQVKNAANDVITYSQFTAEGNEAKIIYLEKVGDYWAFNYGTESDVYIAAGTSTADKSAALRGISPIDDYCKWTISFNGKNAIAENQGNSTYPILSFNNSAVKSYKTKQSGGLRIYKQQDRNLTPQTLSFETASYEFPLNESGYTSFTHQAVSGAQTAVTYTSGNTDVAAIVNNEVVLQGKVGTATITATAEADETYQTASATYTITVTAALRTVTFHYYKASDATAEQAALKEESSNAGITVPANPANVGEYTFLGWAATTLDETQDAPTNLIAALQAGATYHPTTDNEEYHAIYRRLENSDGRFYLMHNNNYVKGPASNNTDLANTTNVAEAAIFEITEDNKLFYYDNNTPTYVSSVNSSARDLKIDANAEGASAWTITESGLTTTFYSSVSSKYLMHNNTLWAAYTTANNSMSKDLTKVYLSHVYYSSTPDLMVSPVLTWAQGNATHVMEIEDTYDNAATATVGGEPVSVTYASSDPNKATVSETGVVTAILGGDVTITATVAAEAGVNRELVESYQVSITKKVPQIVFDDNANWKVYVGEAYKRVLADNVTVTTDGDITYTLSNNATSNTYASVNTNTGEVTGLSTVYSSTFQYFYVHTEETDLYQAGVANKQFQVLALKSQTLTFGENAYVFDFNESVDAFTNALSGAMTDVTYGSDNTDVAEVDAESGEVTVHTDVCGVATITATAAEGYNGTDVYKEATKSYTITVNYPMPTFSMENNSEIKAPISLEISGYDAETKLYWTDGNEDPATLYEASIAISETKTIRAKATNADGSLVSEIASVHITKITPTVNGAQDGGTITLSADENSLITYIILNQNAVTVAEGTDVASPVVYETELSGTYTVSATAKWDVENGFTGEDYDQDFTVKGKGHLPISYEGDGSGLADEAWASVEGGSLGGYDQNTKIKFGSDGISLIAAFAEKPVKLLFDIKSMPGSATWSGAGNLFTVQWSADGETYENLRVYNSTDPMSTTSTSENFDLDPSARYIKWTYETKGSNGGNVALSNIHITCEDVVIDGVSVIDIPEGYTGDVVVEEGVTWVPVNNGYAPTVNNLWVKQGAVVDLNSALLEVNDLRIEAQEGYSGQILKQDNFDITGQAYYDLTLNTTGTMDNTKWYAFAVPFQVDAATGIQRLSNDGVASPAQFNGHYVLLKYNSSNRASTGEGWEYVTAGETLDPGKFYMIALNSNAYNRVRMTKKAGASVNNMANLTLSMYSAADSKNANWNAIANNALAYANVSATGANAGLKVQVYNSATDNYSALAYNEVTFTVGTPFFLQAAEEGTMSVVTGENNHETLKAPAHYAVSTEEFQIRLGENTESYYDILYVSASEEALNEYQIGHDLAKAGVSKTVPQMYVPAYGAKLCDAEFPLENNEATFPLTFTAPNAGTYQLYVAEAAQDAELYLMQNNSIVWNLTLSPYEIALPQGTTEGYSLLLKAKAPSVVTGVDQIDAKAGVQKVIIDEHVYILRGGQMYDVNGKLVK